VRGRTASRKEAPDRKPPAIQTQRNAAIQSAVNSETSVVA
jgi:hypothetical protein